MRGPINKTVLSGDPLRPLARATAQVTTADGEAVTVYTGRTGPTEVTSLVTDVYGRFSSAYVEEGDYDIQITAPNGSSWTEGLSIPVASSSITRKGSALDEGSSMTVTTESQVSHAANTTRIEATITNKGSSGTDTVSTVIWVARGSTATVGQGQAVYPGQTLSIDNYVGDVSVVADSSVDAALSAT